MSQRSTIATVVVIVLLLLGGWWFLSPKSQNNQSNPAVSEQPQGGGALPDVTNSASPAAQVIAPKEITVEGYDFRFEPNIISLKKDEPVRITFKNSGKYPHNLTIQDLNIATKTIQPDQTDTVEFTPDKSGNFSFVCTVDSHADKGMKGTATIK